MVIEEHGQQQMSQRRLTDKAFLRGVLEDAFLPAFAPADDPGAVGRCGIKHTVRGVDERL